MTWWIWILIGLLLLAAEVAVPGGIIMLFFGIAALIVGALVAGGLGGPLWVQSLLFSLLSIVSLTTLRGPILRKMGASTARADRVDAIEGENVLLITDLAPGADGKVEFRGTSWSARNVGNNPLIKGEQGVVEKIKGVTLLIRSQ